MFAGVTGGWSTDDKGSLVLFVRDDTRVILAQSLGEIGRTMPRQIARHDRDVWHCDIDDANRRAACGDFAGEIRIWSLDGDGVEPVRALVGSAQVFPGVAFDASGTLLATAHEDGSIRVWDLVGPPGAEPRTMRFEAGSDLGDLAILASGNAVAATNDADGARLWPLHRAFPRVFRGDHERVSEVAFGPDGSWLVSSGYDGVRRWPLHYREGEPSWRELVPVWADFELSEDGSELLYHRAGPALTYQQAAEGGLVSTDEGPTRTWPGEMGGNVALSADGRWAASGSGGAEVNRVVYLWDTVTGATRVLDAGRERRVVDLQFTPSGRLLAAYCERQDCLLREWDLDNDSWRTLVEGLGRFELSRDGTSVLGAWPLALYDLESGRRTELHHLEPESQVTVGAMAPDQTFAVVGDEDGVIRVAPLAGGEPHLLLGHEKSIGDVAISPDGQWIASGGEDATLRLWPVPDLSETPLHVLPLDELLSTLRSLTNLRAVEDRESSIGWKLEIGPFPGWEQLPSW
jgi:WD40 repeat protein